MNIISYRDAKTAGSKFYFTGKPCPRGHIGLREVRNAGCQQCAREKTAEWRAANIDECRRRARENDRANPEKTKAKYRRNYLKHQDKLKARTREYYAKNGEMVRAKQRENHKKSYLRPEVRLAAKERAAKWAAKNPEQMKVHRRNNKAKRKSAQGRHTLADISDIFRLQKGRCAYCQQRVGEGYRVDHIIALARGGANDRTNLQIVCEPCNLRKWAKDPVDFARLIGLLI